MAFMMDLAERSEIWCRRYIRPQITATRIFTAFFSRADITSSTARSAVRLVSSITGLTSTTSIETM